MSDELIDRLSASVAPVRPGSMRARLVFGLVAGLVAAAVLMLAWLRLRPDLATAVATPMFWAKFAFTLALTGFGLWAVERLARPGGKLRVPIVAVFATIVPSFLMSAGTARIGAQGTAIIGTISPAVTIALAVAVLGEPFGLPEAMGTILVMGGVGLFSLIESRKPAA